MAFMASDVNQMLNGVASFAVAVEHDTNYRTRMRW